MTVNAAASIGFLGKGMAVLWLLAGCTVPLTDGFHRALPSPPARVVVWGNHPSLAYTALTWLQRRGMTTVDQTQLQQRLDQRGSLLVAGPEEEVTVLLIAKELGVDEVVFVMRSGDQRAPMVLVRGVQVDTGQTRWSGSARYTRYVKQPPSHLLATLTCEALATAWGERPAGKQWLTSSQKRCPVEGDRSS